MHFVSGAVSHSLYSWNVASNTTGRRTGGNAMAGIVWFEILADKIERAKRVFGALFGRETEALICQEKV